MDPILIAIITKAKDVFGHAERALSSIDKDTLLLPRGSWPLWKQFYHLTYWMDYWFVDPRTFKPPAFHRNFYLNSDATTDTPATGALLRQYLDEVRDRTLNRLSTLTFSSLGEELTTKDGLRTRAAILFGQFTHASHHIGYICGTYRQLTGRPIW